MQAAPSAAITQLLSIIASCCLLRYGDFSNGAENGPGPGETRSAMIRKWAIIVTQALRLLLDIFVHFLFAAVGLRPMEMS